MTVVLVDAANVVGSRPDGWWRDRAGAAERLLRRLAALPGRTLRSPDGAEFPCTRVVAVVEGQARAAAAPDGVDVVRAPGRGDDALAACAAELAAAGEPLLVVTADRGLRARLPVGTPVAGPGWLLDRLEHGTADHG
ncbi:hypothetical protein [Geodermatophilus sp. URMC 64]